MFSHAWTTKSRGGPHTSSISTSRRIVPCGKTTRLCASPKESINLILQCTFTIIVLLLAELSPASSLVFSFCEFLGGPKSSVGSTQRLNLDKNIKTTVTRQFLKLKGAWEEGWDIYMSGNLTEPLWEHWWINFCGWCLVHDQEPERDQEERLNHVVQVNRLFRLLLMNFNFFGDFQDVYFFFFAAHTSPTGHSVPSHTSLWQSETRSEFFTSSQGTVCSIKTTFFACQGHQHHVWSVEASMVSWNLSCLLQLTRTSWPSWAFGWGRGFSLRGTSMKVMVSPVECCCLMKLIPVQVCLLDWLMSSSWMMKRSWCYAGNG